MGSSADLFGSNVKLLSLQNDPPAVPNEQDLLAAVVAKVGPFADEEKLLYHIRVSAGKVHWAVNSYLRSILASPAPGREDFDSKPRQAQRLPAAGHCSIAPTLSQDAQLLAHRPRMAAMPGPAASSQPTSDAAQQCQCDLAGAHSKSLCSSSEATAALVSAATPNALLLPSLPASVIDSVLALLDLQSLVCAASSCKALYKAAQSESIWRQLFGQRWGPVIFPTSKYDESSNCKNTGSQQAAAQETAASRSTAAAAGQVQIHRADAHSADVLHGGRAESKSAAPVNAAADLGSAGTNSSTTFVSRWTGSSICLGLNDSSSATERASAAEVSVVAAKSPDVAAGHSRRVSSNQAEDNTSSCSSCACLPAVPGCGSWQLQYKQQHSYQAARKCPKCGAAQVVPVVYGFPSGPLLAGMAKKRLLLGGDHLIDSCHVWACSSCRSCYRFYPYGDVQRWLQDDEAQQRLDQARSAAGRGSRREAAAAAERDRVNGVGHQQGGVADDERGLGVDGAEAGAMGFPRYTYEL